MGDWKRSDFRAYGAERVRAAARELRMHGCRGARFAFWGGVALVQRAAQREGPQAEWMSVPECGRHLGIEDFLG